MTTTPTGPMGPCAVHLGGLVGGTEAEVGRGVLRAPNDDATKLRRPASGGALRPLGALASAVMRLPVLAVCLAVGCSGSSPAASPAEAPIGATPPTTAAEHTDQSERAPTLDAQRPPTDETTTAEAGAQPEPPSSDDRWLADLLAAHPDKFATVLDDPARFRAQVLVTVIEPDGRKGPTVVEHGFHVDAEYVYPASAIKTFAAVGALRTLDALRDTGARVDLDTPLAYCTADSSGDRPCTITQDKSNLAGGVITLGHEIRKMQLVSNNIAFNRLYELVGHRELNESMWALGFATLRIHHRMYGVKDPLVQRTTPRVELRPAKGKPVVIPAKVSDLDLPPTEAVSLRIGAGYIDDDTKRRIDEPLDFSGKNYVSVRDLHRLTLAIVRPELPGVVQLGLDEADRAFLIAAMTEDPLESSNPVYTDPHYSGLRYKTMIRGMLRAMPLEQIRYVGKAGRAYGFHLDNAYIEHRQTGRAMAVTVVLYANDNAVLNDNKYEYDGITRPFLKNLGEVLARRVLLQRD